ncbi:hypothetical protein BH09ACT10_BH09ACT10_19530 [soil metagenome]
MPESIEARVQLLEDELALRNLLARYAFNADMGRARAYADLYTEDGAIDLKDMDGPRFEGRESIYSDFITQPMATAAAGRTFHQASPTVFHIDGDNATGEGFGTVLYLGEDGSMTIVQGTYNHWTFRRVDGEWLIAERDFRQMGSPEASTMFVKSVN